MTNDQKIYPAKIGFAADWEGFKTSAKDFFNLLPSAKSALLFVFIGLVLLIFQTVLVGIFDRFGVSPKVSILVSSLFFIAAFAGLAMVGGWRKEAVISADSSAQTVCKLLLIRKI